MNKEDADKKCNGCWGECGKCALDILKEEQAAANKAAEEGELPAGIDYQGDDGAIAAYRAGELVWHANVYGNKDGFDEIACAVAVASALNARAIAADRASRQVANKAEVEPSDSYKAGYADGMDEGAKLAFWGDKPSEKFPEGWPSEIWLNAGDEELGPFSEYDELSWCSAPQGESDVRYIREDLLATPPATTGASTAQANGYLNVIENLESQLAECMKVTEKWASAAGEADGRAFKAEEEVLSLHRQLAAEKLRADQGWQRAEAKSRECIDLRERMAGSVGASTVLTDERIAKLWRDATDQKHGDTTAEFTNWFARAIEREVAAQAGQVAVAEAAIWNAITRLERTDSTQEERFAAADSLRAIAAPSPAKESK